MCQHVGHKTANNRQIEFVKADYQLKVKSVQPVEKFLLLPEGFALLIVLCHRPRPSWCQPEFYHLDIYLIKDIIIHSRIWNGYIGVQLKSPKLIVSSLYGHTLPYYA